MDERKINGLKSGSDFFAENSEWIPTSECQKATIFCGSNWVGFSPVLEGGNWASLAKRWGTNSQLVFTVIDVVPDVDDIDPKILDRSPRIAITDSTNRRGPLRRAQHRLAEQVHTVFVSELAAAT